MPVAVLAWCQDLFRRIILSIEGISGMCESPGCVTGSGFVIWPLADAEAGVLRIIVLLSHGLCEMLTSSWLLIILIILS